VNCAAFIAANSAAKCLSRKSSGVYPLDDPMLNWRSRVKFFARF
jgi:hypothetical protein